MHRVFAIVLALGSVGCAQSGERGAAVPTGASLAPSPADTLVGARTEASGFASIDAVPASPYPAAPLPPAPFEDMFDRFARENRISRSQAEQLSNGSPAFQRELFALTERLRREQPSNFVGVRLVRDPAVAAEVSFKRDAARSLARYTTNPLFRPREGGLSEAEMDALRDVWLKRLQRRKLGGGIGGDPASGFLEIDLGMSEAEYREIAREEGWIADERVRFSFSAPARPALVDQALARFVRIFPRSKQAATIILTVAISGRIVLDDGCFRLAGSGGKAAKDHLVLFDRAATLTRDAQGYLAIVGDDGARGARIGEPAIWGGYPAAVESDPDVRVLRRRCGDGPIASVGVPASERLFALPYPEWVADYARKHRLEFAAAWDRVIGCMKKRDAAGKRGLEARDGCIRQFN